MGYRFPPYGAQSMLREGHEQHLSGPEGAALENTEASRAALCYRARFSRIPTGRKRMVINPLRRALCHRMPQPLLMNSRLSILLLTKILVLSGEVQQEEIGDGVNLTVSFAGELLRKAKELIRMGLHPSEIICGYSKGIDEVCVLECPMAGPLVT